MSVGAPILWMYHEDLRPDVITEEALRLGIMSRVLIGGREVELSAAKIGGLSGEDLRRLRAACYARIGIDDADAYEYARIRELPAFQAWERDRLLHPPAFRQRRSVA